MTPAHWANGLVVETGTPLVNHLFKAVSKERMIALILALGEIVSILVRKKNAGRISETAYRQAMAEFRAEVAAAAGIPLHAVPDDLVCASLPLGDGLVLVTSDDRLVTAAQANGLVAWNPEKDSLPSLDELISSGC